MLRSVRAPCLVACVALVAACGDEENEGAPRPGASTAEMAGAGEGLAFALVRGADTLLVERYTLEGNRVRGTMRDPSGSAVEYETIHATDGGERSMRITMYPANPNAGPPVVSMFTMRGDSAWLESARGDSTQRMGDAVPANALPYMSPSMGMMALVVQSARAMVGDSGRVPLLAASVSQNPVVVSPLIYWRADTAYVIGNDANRFRLVFSNGELMAGENAPQQMRSVRLPPGASDRPGRAPATQPRPAPPSGAAP